MPQLARTLEPSASGGMDRRNFFKLITQCAAAVGLSAAGAQKIAAAVTKGLRPPVIWLHYQECTGCTESLLRTSHPDIAELILDLISLDYHETLMAASGHQAEAALQAAMKRNAGKYICIIEGSIPLAENGIYCQVGGRNAVDIVKEVAGNAGAVIAIGSCASWGGIPSADPNPTGAVGAYEVLKGTTVVNLPGCPANPYILLGVALQYATLGTLPALDSKNRPMFAYGQVIHERCPRRPHFDAGRFVTEFGDAAHRLGYCLYKMGCKGPQTHASCSTQHFCDVDDAWPIGLGHPCIGCTEQSLAFRVPMFDTITIERPQPPDTYASLSADHGFVAPIATGIAGLAAGALIGLSGKVAGMLKEQSSGTPPASNPEAKPPEANEPGAPHGH